MTTEMGEYIVGAYLKLVLKCDVADYNVRPPDGGMKGLEEFDVIGLDLKKKIAYICEVTTHIRGTLYNDNPTTVKRITQKHERQKKYGADYLQGFECKYMFWSPVVAKGYITEHLQQIESLQLVINGEYKRRMNELKVLAKTMTHDTGNPFFRALQILEHTERRRD